MIKTLIKSLREYKKPTLLTPLFVVFEVLLEVLIPLLMSKLIDDGIYSGQMNEILKIGIVLILVLLYFSNIVYVLLFSVIPNYLVLFIN